MLDWNYRNTACNNGLFYNYIFPKSNINSNTSSNIISSLTTIIAILIGLLALFIFFIPHISKIQIENTLSEVLETRGTELTSKVLNNNSDPINEKISKITHTTVEQKFVELKVKI